LAYRLAFILEFPGKPMKKSPNPILSLALIIVSIYLSACSSPNELPPAAEKALEAYWQSLPSYPTLRHQIRQAWPGVISAKTATSLSPNMDVWCVVSEITAAEDSSIIGEKLTWIVFRNDEETDWNAAMLATMSSIWPYEACGNGP
jgi:hypothetical protein